MLTYCGRKVNRMSYHPNYFQQQDDIVRSDCQQRLELIDKYIQNGNLLDIGCSEGFYSFGLCKKCSPILAIDKESHLIQICKNIQQDHNISSTIDFECLGLDDIMEEEDFWDSCLYLSVHHHIMEQFGSKIAKFMLRKLSEKCHTMFFDMGQKNEQNCTMHKWWQLLPSNIDQETWLREYLKTNTTYTDIQLIGSSSIHNVGRLLWKLTK